MDEVETWQFLFFTIGACFAVVAALVIAGSAWFFSYEARKRLAILKAIRRLKKSPY